MLLLLSISPEDAVTISRHEFPVVCLLILLHRIIADSSQGFILSKAVSTRGAIAICCLLIATLMLQVLAQLQASSRFVFALARDNAMPFSHIISRTNKKKQPIYANGIVVGLCMPFALLPLGSQSALYSVLAVTCSTLSYIGYVSPQSGQQTSAVPLTRVSSSLRHCTSSPSAICRPRAGHPGHCAV